MFVYFRGKSGNSLFLFRGSRTHPTVCQHHFLKSAHPNHPKTIVKRLIIVSSTCYYNASLLLLWVFLIPRHNFLYKMPIKTEEDPPPLSSSYDSYPLTCLVWLNLPDLHPRQYSFPGYESMQASPLRQSGSRGEAAMKNRNHWKELKPGVNKIYIYLTSVLHMYILIYFIVVKMLIKEITINEKTHAQ